MSKRGVLIGLIIIVLALAIYFTFFFSYNCDDLSCFKGHQVKCSKAKFVNDKEDITWFYNIKGKEGELCKIEVGILNIKKGTVDKEKLKGDFMDCYLPLGYVGPPEADIESCHGILKEEIQEMMIKNAHKYIVENIGEIGEELSKVV